MDADEQSALDKVEQNVHSHTEDEHQCRNLEEVGVAILELADTTKNQHLRGYKCTPQQSDDQLLNGWRWEC